ncbi:hypothetical protein NUM_49080 [Actinocatenispora comari]|uniref:Uncharacterized protein n=1 Tax=Actinocatenispora comari TaxID=2807577 RepID=A0A8J4AE35_9ACTN|nr:hypothetical protein NUM_49080 [Actinocatenispora comari]
MQRGPERARFGQHVPHRGEAGCGQGVINHGDVHADNLAARRRRDGTASGQSVSWEISQT